MCKVSSTGNRYFTEAETHKANKLHTDPTSLVVRDMPLKRYSFTFIWLSKILKSDNTKF